MLATIRTATAAEHTRTEESFADALANFPASYSAYLEAHAAAFPAVGEALAAALDWEPWRQRWQDLRADLSALGVATPAPVVVAPAASRAEALGMAYVLEGSRMGSTLILKSIPADHPRAYLNGGLERAPWLRLKDILQSEDPAIAEAVIAGARKAFDAFRIAADARLPRASKTAA